MERSEAEAVEIEQNWERVVDIVPKLRPEAAKRYYAKHRKRAVVRSQDKLILKAKRHIVALGWIIESNSEGKLRFIAPNGTVYDDLREVCKLVTEQEEKARAGSGESKKKEPRIKLNWKPLPIEPKPCHEAVVAYVREGRRRRKLRPTVVRHIVSLGWVVECYEEKYRYRAPDGKMHCSLLEICRSLTGPPEQDARGSSLAEQEETSED